MSKRIDFYDPKKEFGFMSNFYQAPFNVKESDKTVTYPTSEHYFQVKKFEPIGISDEKLLKSYRWYQKQILSQNTAGKVKFLSDQKIKGGYPWTKPLLELVRESKERKITIRPDWDKIDNKKNKALTKISVMIVAVVNKFIQNPKLLDKLLETYPAKLYENSPRDSYWGVGKDGKGQNWLGRILTCVRDVLRKYDKKQLRKIKF